MWPEIMFIRHTEDLDWPLPSRRSEGAAGFDLAALTDADSYQIAPGATHLFTTGWGVELPPGYEGHIRPRSGLLCHYGVYAFSGTIDRDYRGEIIVALINFGPNPYVVKKGDRVAQLVIGPCLTGAAMEAESVSETGRGANGFGYRQVRGTRWRS